MVLRSLLLLNLLSIQGPAATCWMIDKCEPRSTNNSIWGDLGGFTSLSYLSVEAVFINVPCDDKQRPYKLADNKQATTMQAHACLCLLAA